MMNENKLKNKLTYMFKHKKTGEVMGFYPLFGSVKFISSPELGFAAHHASGNTCKMIAMLEEVLNKNEYLTQFVPNVLGLNIPKIHSVLSQKASAGQRDGWDRFNGPNPKLAAELFNTDNKKQNLNVDISCAGKDDDDMSGVVFDDFLSKYFDKAKTAKKELHRQNPISRDFESYNTTNEEILYYRNLNITGASKLVTGLSNFNMQVFRRELLKRKMFLGNDMNVYTIGSGQFQFGQDLFFSLYTSQITRCFKLITENVWLDDNNTEHNLYDSQEASYAEAAKDYLLACFQLMNHDLFSSFYDSNSGEFINDFELSYDCENKRFVIKYRNGVESDATAWLYDQLCNAVTKNLTIASTRKPLKTFLDEQERLYRDELELDKAARTQNNQNYVPVHNSLCWAVQESHNTEKLNLVNNIVGYFTKDLTANKLNEVQVTEQEKKDMKKGLFEKTLIEFFFKNTHSVNDAIQKDILNLRGGSDSERDVTKYILSNSIDSILTEQGLELMNIIKKELASDARIVQDGYFNEYKLRSENIYQNNQNQKTKIEFSVLKALIECINDGSMAYDNFFRHLSNYLNYFFCNQDNLSKKKLTEQIDKKYNDINNGMDSCDLKKNERQKAMKKKNLTDQQIREINKEYGTNADLKKKGNDLTKQMNELKKKYFFGNELQKVLEADYNSRFDAEDNEIPLKDRKTIKLEKFKRCFFGYEESLLFDGIREKISSFVDANSLLEDKILEGIEDRKEKISKKTKILIGEIESKIGALKTKITIEWVELCIKYILIREKMKKQTVSDGIVTQDNIEKNPDEYLNFLILDLFIGFKEADNEFKDNQSGSKKSEAYKDDRIMYWFNFLQNFINAGYFLTNDCTPDEMCEYIYHVRDIEFFMNHDPRKLETLLAGEGDNPADALINFLFKNIAFGDEEKKKQVIKTLKMMVCQFSVILSSTQHMTQFNMMKFDFKDRKLSNGVLYGTNGLSDCFMVPIQTAYNKAKEIDPASFNQNIEDILPKLPEGMKWADTNKDCGLFFDNTEAEWEMLPVDEVERMCVDDEKLSQAARVNDYCLKLLVKRNPQEFNEFLMLANVNDNVSSNVNVFAKICENKLRRAASGATHRFWDACNNSLNVMHIINGFVSENNKKIGLALMDVLVSGFASNLLKYAKDRSIGYNYKRNWLEHIFNIDRGDLEDDYKIIETITSLVGNIYFKWNNVADESERTHCENILSSVLGVLEIALTVMTSEAIFGNNEDLILWLYLMYKKARCDHNFANRNQTLTSDNGKYFLKNYKIGDGAEKIFKKNVFFMNDDRSGFINFIKEKQCWALFNRVEETYIHHIPFEFLTLEKYRELSSEPNESKIKLKTLFEKRIEKDDLRVPIDKQIRDANNKSIVEMFKSISDPEKILKTLNESSNPKHLFWAFKNLCQGEIANKSPEGCKKGLQKLLLSNESENIIKKLFRDSQIGFNRSLNKVYDDQINMSIDSIELLSDLVLNKNMKISLTTATDLVEAIQKLVVNLSDEEINRRPFDFNEKYRNYFRGDRNIFDFVVKIIGQIPVSSISETADADKKLEALSKSFDHIFNSEVMGRAKNPQEMLLEHKDFGLWMYSLYKRAIYDKDQNDHHNKDEDVLLKECKIEATPDEMRKQGIILDGNCINEFKKWFKSQCGNPGGEFKKFGDIYQYLCENALFDLTSNQDWTAFYELSERFPNKIKDLLLSDEKDSVISKLCLSVNELFKPLEIKVNVGSANNPNWIEAKNPTTNQIATHKAATQLHWVRRYFDIYSMIKEKEKLSFRVALSYIKFVHDICRYLRKFKLGSPGFTMGIEKLWPKPLEAILDAIEKISFTKGDIEQFASKEEYDELLKIIQDEVNYYNTDDRNITDEVLYKLRKEGKEPKQDDKYFAQDKKSDLLWYLSLLNEKINNGNYCSTKDDDTIEFKKCDGDYSICNYKLSKILNEKNQEENKSDNQKVLATVISRFKDEKFLPVVENSGLEHWKETCITHLEKNLKQIKLNKMTGKLKNVFKKEYTQAGKMFLEQLENRRKKIKASKILKNRILTVDRKQIARVFKPWREKAIKLRDRENRLTQFNDLLAEKRKNALSDAFTEIKSKFDESKKLDGAQKLYNIAKKLNDKKIANLPKKTLSTWNNNAQNIKKNEKMDILNNATVNPDKGVKVKFKGVKKDFLDTLKNNANKANNVEKVAIDNISSNDANKISNPNNNKQAMLDMYFGRTKKSFIGIILDCVLATLAIVFLREIALIIATTVAAAIFVVLCVYLTRNIICYNVIKSEIAEHSDNTNDHAKEIDKDGFDLSKYKELDNRKESNDENINKDNDLNI